MLTLYVSNTGNDSWAGASDPRADRMENRRYAYRGSFRERAAHGQETRGFSTEGVRREGRDKKSRLNLRDSRGLIWHAFRYGNIRTWYTRADSPSPWVSSMRKRTASAVTVPI